MQLFLTYSNMVPHTQDFVLAMENKSDPQSIQYLFRVLDTRHEGFLSVFSLNYFFRAIQDEMKLHGQVG